jgi:hypothetical protein
MSTLIWTYLGCSRAQHLFRDVPFQCRDSVDDPHPTSHGGQLNSPQHRLVNHVVRVHLFARFQHGLRAIPQHLDRQGARWAFAGRAERGVGGGAPNGPLDPNRERSADVPEVQNSHGRAYGEEGKQCREFVLGVCAVSEVSAYGGSGVMGA